MVQRQWLEAVTEWRWWDGKRKKKGERRKEE